MPPSSPHSRRRSGVMPNSDGSLARAWARKTTLYFCYILLICTLGPYQFGFHLAELNAPSDVISCEKDIVRNTSVHTSLPQCIAMNVDQFATVTSLFTLGGLIGALIAGPFCNKFGRLRAMRYMTAPFELGAVLECVGTNIPMLAIGRILSGVGAGASLVVVPLYISETAPPDQKGLYGALTQIMTNVGIVTAQTLGLFLSRGSLWRIIVAVPAGITVMMFLGLGLVPESPKWLAERGSHRRAKQILRRIRGGTVNVDEEFKAWAVSPSAENLAEEESLLPSQSHSHAGSKAKSHVSSMGIIEVFLSPKHQPGVIAVVVVMVTQQFTGINSIVMYSVKLLATLLPTSAALLSVGISLLNLVMTTLCAPLPDKYGRKTAILLSTGGMGVSSILLAVGISSNGQVLGGVASLCFVASFAVGLGPVPFILANELVSTEAVGATQSWALATNWVATFVVSQFFPMLNKLMGGNGHVYYIFAAMALILGLFIAYWVPETKGKKSVDEVWGRETNQRPE